MKQLKANAKFSQKIIIFRQWVSERQYLIPIEQVVKEPILDNMGIPIERLEAVYNGIDSHFDHQNKGFGTKFHDVYVNSPKVYDDFSWAEDRKDIILRKLLKFQKEHALKSLLDVACGTGKFLNKLHNESSFNKLYGLDLSNSLLQYARQNLAESVQLLKCSAEQIPFLDNSIDCCFTSWGSFSPNETLMEMERVTCSGGIICRIGTSGLDEFTHLFPNYREYIVHANMKYLHSCGFNIEIFPIEITFPTLESAKKILTNITGCKENEVTKSTLIHNVSMAWKIVTK